MNYNARTREQLFLLLLVISVEEMSITSVRERLSVNAMSRDLQNPTAPAPLGRRQRHLACVFYIGLGTPVLRSRIFNFGTYALRHRPQVNPAAFAHSVYTQ